MGLVWRQGVLFTLLFALALPARAADPILMFLLSFAKNIIERQVEESLRKPAFVEPMPDLGKVYPGTTVEPEVVRRLIDDSFLYLSAAQRREIFESFNKALLDPKMAAMRGVMIEHFASRALAVRAAQIRLSQLSYREKQFLAEEFKREIAAVPDADLAPLHRVIEQNLLPVPADLNQLFFAVLEQRPGIALAARTPPPAPVAENAPAAKPPAAPAAQAPGASVPAADAPLKPAEPAAAAPGPTPGS